MGNAYPPAPGIRNIGDTTMRFIPEVYSGKLLIKFYARTFLTAISNTDYEGDIKDQGDTVYIRSDPTITIRDHQKGQNLVHEQPVSTPTTLLIDKGKYWAFSTNKVDDAQTDIKSYTERWTTAASKDLAVSIETAILADVYSDAHASNQGATAGAVSAGYNLGVAGSPIGLTKANVLEKIVDCQSVIREQNIPEEDEMFMVIPEWMANLMQKSDLKAVNVTGDNVSPIRNGQIGRVGDFMLYRSNILATTADGGGQTATNIIFGTKRALTFASQLTENENLQNPFAFGRLFRGLQVYGYKVVEPKALGWLYAYAA